MEDQIIFSKGVRTKTGAMLSNLCFALGAGCMIGCAVALVQSERFGRQAEQFVTFLSEAGGFFLALSILFYFMFLGKIILLRKSNGDVNVNLKIGSDVNHTIDPANSISFLYATDSGYRSGGLTVSLYVVFYGNDERPQFALRQKYKTYTFQPMKHFEKADDDILRNIAIYAGPVKSIYHSLME